MKLFNRESLDVVFIDFVTKKFDTQTFSSIESFLTYMIIDKGIVNPEFHCYEVSPLKLIVGYS